MDLTLPASPCRTSAAARPTPPAAGFARLSWLLLVPVALLLSGDAAPGAALWPSEPPARSLLLLCAGGMLSGLLAGLLGIGGALVTIPVLYLALPAIGIEPALVPATPSPRP